MLADNLEIRTARKIADLEKRITDLERLVSWHSIEGSVVFAFVITMLAANFIFRKVASWCLD